jgi:putative membrane protein
MDSREAAVPLDLELPAGKPAGEEPRRSSGVQLVALGASLCVLGWSSVGPHDRATWLMEVAPALIAIPILVATRGPFPLTPLLYALIAIHVAILSVGGHYTYAEVPVGFWLRDARGRARNHYDRLGHLAQGFIPALVTREILLRTSPLRPGRWLAVLVTSVALAISAMYELIEWAAATWLGQGADAFLGTQGDVWDTQSDMLMALLGAVAAQLCLARLHDGQIARLGNAAGGTVVAPDEQFRRSRD